MPLIRAGTPMTIAWSGTSFVTTAPAPIIAFSPIVIPARIIAPEPTDVLNLFHYRWIIDQAESGQAGMFLTPNPNFTFSEIGIVFIVT